MDKVLITGGTGLIGQSLIDNLLPHFEVISIGKNKPKGEAVKHIILDLASTWDISKLPEKVDVIIHLAQSAHFREFPEKSEDIFHVNTLSTLKLLNYAQNVKVKKFMYASSGGVYGKGNDGFVEDTPIISNNRLGFYLGTKLCSEVLVENYSTFFDVDIMRFFFVFGEHQKESMLIPRLVNAVKKGEPIMLQGVEGIKVNPIYVGDAVLAINNLIPLKGSRQINIGGKEVLSIKDIAEIIGEKVKKEPVFKFIEGEPNNLVGDISKIEKIVGLPFITFEQGIEKLLTK